MGYRKELKTLNGLTMVGIKKIMLRQRFAKLVTILICTFRCTLGWAQNADNKIYNPESDHKTMLKLRELIDDGLSTEKDYHIDSICCSIPQFQLIESKDTTRAKELYNRNLEFLKGDKNRLKLLENLCNTLIDSKRYRIHSTYSIVSDEESNLLQMVPYHLVDSESNAQSVYGQLKKNRVTDNTIQYLSKYITHLTDSINHLDRSYEQILNSLPIKRTESLTESLTVTNPYYIGFNWNSPDDLDKLEYKGQSKWKFLNTSNYEVMEDRYPIELKYLKYKDRPELKVMYDDNTYTPTYVFDKNGKLVYVVSLQRNGTGLEFEEIKRLIYQRDYQNNKYGVKSEGERTQQYLQKVLCRENGFNKTETELIGGLIAPRLLSAAISETAANYDITISPELHEKMEIMKKKMAVEAMKAAPDKKAADYIWQLTSDHESEFSYIYMIRRLSNVSFKVVYLDKDLHPSHCAIITYKTGNKPYTREFSAHLVDMPTNIPPAIKGSGELLKRLRDGVHEAYNEEDDN